MTRKTGTTREFMKTWGRGERELGDLHLGIQEKDTFQVVSSIAMRSNKMKGDGSSLALAILRTQVTFARAFHWRGRESSLTVAV